MFNFTEITFMLMDAGANVSAKNSQGGILSMKNLFFVKPIFVCPF
jgi:hypothetical protein